MPPDISSIDIATHSQLSPTQSQHSKLPRSSSFAMSMTRSAVTSRRTNTMSFVPPQFQAIPEIVPLAKATTTISFSPPRSTSPPPSYTAGRRPSDSPSLSDSEYVLLATSARSRESPPSRYEPSPQAQLQTTETSIRTEWRIKFAFEQFGQGSSVITTIIGMVMGVSGLIVSVCALVVVHIVPSFRAKPPSLAKTPNSHPSSRSSEHQPKGSPRMKNADLPPLVSIFHHQSSSKAQSPSTSLASTTADHTRRVTFQLEKEKGDAESITSAATPSNNATVGGNGSILGDSSRPTRFFRTDSGESYASGSTLPSCTGELDQSSDGHSISPPPSTSSTGGWHCRDRNDRSHGFKNMLKGSDKPEKEKEPTFSRLRRSFTISHGHTPELAPSSASSITTTASSPAASELGRASTISTTDTEKLRRAMSIKLPGFRSLKRRSLPADAPLPELLATYANDLVDSPTSLQHPNELIVGPSIISIETPLPTSTPVTQLTHAQATSSNNPCTKKRHRAFSFLPMSSSDKPPKPLSAPSQLRTNPYLPPFNAMPRERRVSGQRGSSRAGSDLSDAEGSQNEFGTGRKDGATLGLGRPSTLPPRFRTTQGDRLQPQKRVASDGAVQPRERAKSSLPPRSKPPVSSSARYHRSAKSLSDTESTGPISPTLARLKA